VLARPVELNIKRQRSVMPVSIGVSSEAHELLASDRQVKAKLPTLVEIALDGCLNCGVIHAALPGQGIATADKRVASTLA